MFTTYNTYPTTEEEFETRQAEFKRSLSDEFSFYMSVLARVEHQKINFHAHMDLLYMDLVIIVDFHTRNKVNNTSLIALINSITAQFHNYFNVYRKLRECLIDNPIINQLNNINQLLTDETAARMVQHLSYHNILCHATRSPQILQIFEDYAIKILESGKQASQPIPYEMRRLAMRAWSIGRLRSDTPAPAEPLAAPDIPSVCHDLRTLRPYMDSHGLSSFNRAIDTLTAIHNAQQTEEIARLKQLLN